MHAEIDRVRRLKTCGKTQPWPSRGEGLEGGPYQAKFGDRWEEEMKQKLCRNGHICVTDLMKHVIREGNIMFQGTPFEDNWYTFMHQSSTHKLIVTHLH